MAETPTLFASGTTTPTVTTETFLSSPGVAGAFQLVVDTSNMVAGDVLVIRAYRIVLSAGAVVVTDNVQYAGVQTFPIKESAMYANELVTTNALRFSITQTFGTARAFPWKVMQL